MLTRRTFLGAGAAAPILAASASLAASRPNILLIIADDLGKAGLGPYGAAVYKTPALDRMAAEGRTFTRFYVNPLCSPTRAEMLTGLYPSRTGWKTNLELQPDDNKTLRGSTYATVLRDAGYTNAIAGKWHVGNLWTHPLHTWTLGFGFSRMSLDTQTTGLWGMRLLTRNGTGDPQMVDLPGSVYGPDVQTDWLLDFMARPGPWLAVMALDLPHVPLEATPLTKGRPWKDGSKRWFAGMVRYMDHLTGRLVDAAPPNTLVIFCTDNGNPKVLGGGKATLRESGINVPLIARWPGVIPPGTRAHGLSDATDFMPTFAALAGGGAVSDGVSLVPQFTGVGGKPHAFAHWQDGNANEHWAVIERKRKLAAGELFDLSNDALEQNPLRGRRGDFRWLRRIGKRLSAEA